MNADKERYDRLVAEHRDPARLTAEILEYWQQQAAEARALNEIYVAELMAKSSRLETSEKALRKAEQRIDLLDRYDRASRRTGYRTPWTLPGVTIEKLIEECEAAERHEGQAITIEPYVVAKGDGECCLRPVDRLVLRPGDQVFGVIIDISGNQISNPFRAKR